MSSARARQGDGPDPRFMRDALELARRGLESVSPNPMVGAVLVRNGRVLARGFHRAFGRPHAEVDCLSRVAGARGARGADLYVTLEPCGHQGKTPPCAAAIARAGVRRVFYAASDPAPWTRGKGPRMLRSSGVEVRGGLLRREAKALNAPYFHFQKTGRPWVILKWAMSLDGKIATASGESRWISGAAARRVVHGLRRRVDAILVGTATVLCDDPLLTPRPARGRRPYRVVLDRQGRLPLQRRILRPEPDGKAGPRLYVTSARVPTRRLRRIEGRGLTVVVVPERRGRLDLEAVFTVLGRLGISQVLVEGGGEVGGGCLERGLVDEVAAFVAARLIGGQRAPSPIEGRGSTRLAETPRVVILEREELGGDLFVRGRVVQPGTGW